MTNTTDGSPKAFLIYESTYQSMMECLSEKQVYEFIRLLGQYSLYEDRDVKSTDPMVEMLLKMNKPVVDAAEKRHRIAVENGKKGAKYGKLGGAPKGNQNARKNNPQTTPNQPLEKEIEKKKEIEKNKEIEDKSNMETCSRTTNTSLQSFTSANRINRVESNQGYSYTSQDASDISQAMERQIRRGYDDLQRIYKTSGLSNAYFNSLDKVASDMAYYLNDNDTNGLKKYLRTAIEKGVDALPKV